MAALDYRLLTDMQGRSYQLYVTSDEADYFEASLLDARTHVGYVRCLIESPDEMVLCDVVVFAEALVHRNFLQKCWDRLLGQYPKTASCQKRGLGTLLLALIIEEARRRRIHRILGVIVSDDLEKNPHLVHWYTKHGFVVDSPVPGDFAGAVYRITHELYGG